MKNQDKKDIAPTIFSGSTTMIGVCITVITLFIVTKNELNTYLDEVLSLDAFLFIMSAFISYLSLRWNNHRHLEIAADIFFFTGMLIMVFAGMLLVFLHF